MTNLDNKNHRFRTRATSVFVQLESFRAQEGLARDPLAEAKDELSPVQNVKTVQAFYE